MKPLRLAQIENFQVRLSSIQYRPQQMKLFISSEFHAYLVRKQGRLIQFLLNAIDRLYVVPQLSKKQSFNQAACDWLMQSPKPHYILYTYRWLSIPGLHVLYPWSHLKNGLCIHLLASRTRFFASLQSFLLLRNEQATQKINRISCSKTLLQKWKWRRYI